MSQGSQSEARRSNYSYLSTATSSVKHDLQTMPQQNPRPNHTNSTTGPFTGNLSSSSHMSSGLWAGNLSNALSLPRIVPSSTHTNLSYSSSMVPYLSYNMDSLVVSPPLGHSASSHNPKSFETDPYHVPPLSTTSSSHSSSGSRPGTGDSPGGRRGIARVQSPGKKRKTGEGKLPTFLVRLYELLKEPKYPNLLSWDKTGRFIVAHTSDPQLLEVLKSEYNQNRVASFTRQLNIYGWMRDNITRNTESTEPTLWRHDSLNRDSTLDDLLATVRRVAPRTSQAEKRRKMEEEEAPSPLRSSMHQNTWPPLSPLSPSGIPFSLGTSPPLDTGFGHRRQRSRRYSYTHGLDMEDCGGSAPRSIQNILPLQPQGDGRMLSQSAPTNTSYFSAMTNPRTEYVSPSDGAASSNILANPGVRFLTTTVQAAYSLPLSPSTNTSLQYQINDPTTWARHGISRLGQGLKPFQPAPLDGNSSENHMNALTNGFQAAVTMPQTPQQAPLTNPSQPRSAGGPGSPREGDEIIVTPPPPPPQTLRQATVAPGSYMGILNAPRTPTGSWTPSTPPISRAPNGSVHADVLAPRSSSVLQRVMHGQSGVAFVAEENGDPLPSANLPQPRLFDDIGT